MSGTRDDLHRVAAHILARRRFDVSGHFGLRASPGGIATPAFGPEPEVVRIAGTSLVREIGSDAACTTLNGASLTDLAAFAGVELQSEFSVGANTPPLGDPDEPLRLDHDELSSLVAWFDLGWRVLDAFTASLGEGWDRTTTQLWPEHFDVGTAVTRSDPHGPSANLGYSPGDAFSADPYVYVGPWGPERPGDPDYWNAPFGAFAPRAHAPDAPAGIGFLRTGIDALVAS
jgi:hypothetical protein